MAIQTTTFKGARYIVKFHDPIQWSDAVSYEAIEAVQYNAYTYISKQPVPAGIQIDNEAFWLCWADPNAQMEQLRQLVSGYVDQVDALESKIPASAFSSTNTVKKYIDFDASKAHVFDTVADMKASGNLSAGAVCHTNGFNAANDSGAAWYVISDTGTANEIDVIQCGDLYAALVTSNIINIRQLGAQDDVDCTAIIERAIAIAEDGNTIEFPTGRYVFEKFECEKTIEFDFCNSELKSTCADGEIAIKLQGDKRGENSTTYTKFADKLGTLANAENGDLVVVKSADPLSLSRTYYCRGMQNKVVDAANKKIQTRMPLDIVTSTCEVFAPNRSIVKNISGFTCDNFPEALIEFEYCIEGGAFDCHIDAVSYAGIVAKDSYAITISDCVVTTYHLANDVNSYAIGINASSCCIVRNCICDSDWDGLDIGYNYPAVYNTFEDCITNKLDMHANAFETSIVRCIVKTEAILINSAHADGCVFPNTFNIMGMVGFHDYPAVFDIANSKFVGVASYTSNIRTFVQDVTWSDDVDVYVDNVVFDNVEFVKASYTCYFGIAANLTHEVKHVGSIVFNGCINIYPSLANAVFANPTEYDVIISNSTVNRITWNDTKANLVISNTTWTQESSVAMAGSVNRLNATNCKFAVTTPGSDFRVDLPDCKHLVINDSFTIKNKKPALYTDLKLYGANANMTAVVIAMAREALALAGFESFNCVFRNTTDNKVYKIYSVDSATLIQEVWGTTEPVYTDITSA